MYPATTAIWTISIGGFAENMFIADLVSDAVSIHYTGGYPLIEVAQQQLLGDLIKGFILASAVICPVMMIVLRGIGAGLLVMIPNVTPVVAVCDVMGWLGRLIDIGTALTASVALEIAVMDTLRFVTSY